MADDSGHIKKAMQYTVIGINMGIGITSPSELKIQIKVSCKETSKPT